jgi:hypothetical protein
MIGLAIGVFGVLSLSLSLMYSFRKYVESIEVKFVGLALEEG